MPSPLGAQLQDLGDTNQYGGRTVDEEFWNLTATAISAGDWVARDLTDYTSASFPTRQAFPTGSTCQKAPATTGVVIGVAIEAIPAGACGKVRRSGLIKAQCPASTLVGSALTIGGSAGVAALQTAATFLPVIGVSLEAGGAGLLKVDVRCV